MSAVTDEVTATSVNRPAAGLSHSASGPLDYI